MAIEERIGFQVGDAIANLNALNAAILQVNTSITTLNTTAGRGGLNNATAALNRINTAANQARAGVQGVNNALTQAGQAGTQAGNSLTLSWQTFARVVVTQAIVRSINAVIEAFGQAAEAAAAFEIETARIANITDEGVKGIDGLRDSIRELAVTTGRELGEVTKAALEALQNDLGTTAETFKLLAGSADDLAKSTGTNLTSSINSISSVLKSFNIDISQSADVADTLFVAFDKGRISLSELENRLGTVTPQLNTLEVAFSEGAAAVASLTLSGLNSATAMTQLRNILDKMIRPTDQLKEAFKRLGVDSGKELIDKFGGLQGALKALKEEFDNNDEAVAGAFGTIRGQLGVLNLLANEGTNFTTVLKAMEGRLGAVKRAADTVNQTTTQQINEQFAKLSNTLLPVGQAINQLKLDALTLINDFIAGLTKLQQRKDFQLLEESTRSFRAAFVEVIADLIASTEQFLGILVGGAQRASIALQGIFDPVGAAASQRVVTIQNAMSDIENAAITTAKKLVEQFKQPLPDTPVKPLLEALRKIEGQARLSFAQLKAQALAAQARIDANVTAVANFEAALLRVTAPINQAFGKAEAFAPAREQLRAISAELTKIATQAATASGVEARELALALNLQKEKVAAKEAELGPDNAAVKALKGQVEAAEQVLLNAEGKKEFETQFSGAAKLANEALAAQKVAADNAKLSLEGLGLAGDGARKAITDIPDPSVDATASIAQMNALAEAARQAAIAVAAANSGGGVAQYHGGFMHRASGGDTRGADTIPAMLSPGEFVMNKRSTGRFFSQLQAMNAGQSTSFRESGGAVTNIGDINVNVTGGAGGESSAQTARQIASGLRRELRRKTSRLS